MSIQCFVACLDCKAFAPDVGDGGHLGSPVLAPSPDAEFFGDPWPTFGWFYEPLSGLGVCPYDLEAFHEFLIKHQGHRLCLATDHDDSEKWPPELQAMTDDDDESSEQVTDEREVQDALRDKRCMAGEFLEALYELACVTCDRAMRSEVPELLRQIQPFEPPAQVAALFIERWGRTPDDGWNHRLMGIVDPFEPFIGTLVAFLREHRGHVLRARVLAK